MPSGLLRSKAKGRLSLTECAHLADDLAVVDRTAWLRHVRKNPEKASPWLRGMMARKPFKLVAVAQAARTARILWAMLTHDQPYRPALVA